MKTLFVVLGLVFSVSTFAQRVVTAEKNNDGADLCFHKQIQLKGYAYANLIGRCAWDPAMNGMTLSLVAVPEDPTQDAHAITLDNVRDVKLVENKAQQIHATVIQDTFDRQGNIIQRKKLISVRSIDPVKGTFSVKN